MESRTLLIGALLRRVEASGETATNICARISDDLNFHMLKLTFRKMQLPYVSARLLFLKYEIHMAPLKFKITGNFCSKINSGGYLIVYNTVRGARTVHWGQHERLGRVGGRFLDVCNAM